MWAFQWRVPEEVSCSVHQRTEVRGDPPTPPPRYYLLLTAMAKHSHPGGCPDGRHGVHALGPPSGYGLVRLLFSPLQATGHARTPLPHIAVALSLSLNVTLSLSLNVTLSLSLNVTLSLMLMLGLPTWMTGGRVSRH